MPILNGCEQCKSQGKFEVEFILKKNSIFNFTSYVAVHSESSWTASRPVQISRLVGKPNQRNSISVEPSYVEPNSIYRVSSYVEEHSAQLDSSWTVSGPVQISGLGVRAQTT